MIRSDSLRIPVRRKALRHGTDSAHGAAAAATRPEPRDGHFGLVVERLEGVVGGEVLLAEVGAVRVVHVAALAHPPLHVPRRLVLGQGRLAPRMETSGSTDAESVMWRLRKGQQRMCRAAPKRKELGHSVIHLLFVWPRLTYHKTTICVALQYLQSISRQSGAWNVPVQTHYSTTAA